jgi:hypothetical protein
MRGRLRSIPSAPAAGAELSFVVPAQKRWGVRGLVFRLTCDATAGNRMAVLAVKDAAGNIVNYFGNAGAITPANNRLSAYLPGTSGAPFASLTVAPSFVFGPAGLPEDLVLGPGWSLVSITNGIAAADQYSEAFLSVEEWDA